MSSREIQQACYGQKRNELIEGARWAQLICDNLSPDLLHPKVMPSAKYNVLGHPYVGHCYVASEALWHLWGAAEFFTPHRVKLGHVTHWYLENAAGDRIDPTVLQFRVPVPYEQGVAAGFLTTWPSKRTRILISRLLQKGLIPNDEEHRQLAAV